MIAFYILVALGAVALVFLLAPWYRDLGGVLKGIFMNAKDAVEAEDEDDDDR